MVDAFNSYLVIIQQLTFDHVCLILVRIFSNNMSLLSVFIHLTHPCWIKVLISFKKKETNLVTQSV